MGTFFICYPRVDYKFGLSESKRKIRISVTKLNRHHDTFRTPIAGKANVGNT